MPYITLPIMPAYPQITLLDILSGDVPVARAPVAFDDTSTRTHYTEYLKPRFREQYDFFNMANLLMLFNKNHSGLFEKDRESLYNTWLIPKKTGGVRRIDEPHPELMVALRELKTIFETEFSPSKNRFSLYHTSAFAYVPGRCHKDTLVKHQGNKSWWFLGLDFSNFFGSTTKEFTLRMLKQIFPFSEMFKYTTHRKELEKAIDLCFLNGGLPQGTPISPMLTNIVMLPIDYEICRELRKMESPTAENPSGNSFVYTRYADDITISAKRSFQYRKVQEIITNVLKKFEAPYVFKEEKTSYGSRAGRNWQLGLMLNKDNKITIGSERKHRFRATIDNYITNHDKWTLHDVQVLAGNISYYMSVEPDYMNGSLSYYSEKYGVNIMGLIKRDLAG